MHSDVQVNQVAYRELFESFAGHIGRCREVEALLEGREDPQTSSLDLEEDEMDVIVELVNPLPPPSPTPLLPKMDR